MCDGDLEMALGRLFKARNRHMLPLVCTLIHQKKCQLLQPLSEGLTLYISTPSDFHSHPCLCDVSDVCGGGVELTCPERRLRPIHKTADDADTPYIFKPPTERGFLIPIGHLPCPTRHLASRAIRNCDRRKMRRGRGGGGFGS